MFLAGRRNSLNLKQSKVRISHFIFKHIEINATTRPIVRSTVEVTGPSKNKLEPRSVIRHKLANKLWLVPTRKIEVEIISKKSVGSKGNLSKNHQQRPGKAELEQIGLRKESKYAAPQIYNPSPTFERTINGVLIVPFFRNGL